MALKASSCTADAAPGHIYRGTAGLLYRKSVSGSAADQVLVPVGLRVVDGSEFLNSALRAVNKRWGIHHHSTGGYQPHGNPVERYHRFLNSVMATLALTFGDDWPSYLPTATFAREGD
jgi:hypothetical protein